jgi:hypothetical protein
MAKTIVRIGLYLILAALAFAAGALIAELVHVQ